MGSQLQSPGCRQRLNRGQPERPDLLPLCPPQPFENSRGPPEPRFSAYCTDRGCPAQASGCPTWHTSLCPSCLHTCSSLLFPGRRVLRPSHNQPHLLLVPFAPSDFTSVKIPISSSAPLLLLPGPACTPAPLGTHHPPSPNTRVMDLESPPLLTFAVPSPCADNLLT